VRRGRARRGAVPALLRVLRGDAGPGRGVTLGRVAEQPTPAAPSRPGAAVGAVKRGEPWERGLAALGTVVRCVLVNGVELSLGAAAPEPPADPAVGALSLR